MRDSDYYPAGAYNDPNAPYNQHDNDDKEFECVVTETLTKTIFVTTNNYQEFEDVDSEGHHDHWFETDDVDWEDEYCSRQYTLKEVLDKCVEVFEKIEQYCTKDYKFECIDNKVLKDIQLLKEHCSDWETEEIDVSKQE